MKISFSQYLLIVFFSLGLGACEPNIPGVEGLPEMTKSPQDSREYSAVMLDNQLQVVLVSDPSLENAVASLIVQAGSAQDPDEFPGLAHYLEHMLFQGTEKYPEPNGFMKFVQANAGTINASTGFNNTHYFFQINAGKLDQALDQFSDYFKRPRFDPIYSDKERNAVHNEWSWRKANDQWIIHRLSGITASPEYPLRKFNLGNLETLKDLPEKTLRQAMQEYYQQYYSANLMKLVIIGNQSIPDLKTLAAKHFLTIPNQNRQIPVVKNAGLTAKEMGKLIRYKPQQEIKSLYVEYPIDISIHQWSAKLSQFMVDLLKSSEKGTLNHYLQEQQLITNINVVVGPDYYLADGVLRIEFEMTSKGVASPDAVIAATFAYIEQLNSHGISDEYFKQQQFLANNSFIYGARQDAIQAAVNINMMQFYNMPIEHLLDGHYLMEAGSRDVLNKLISQLQPRNARIWFIDKNQEVDKEIPYYQGRYSIRDIQESEWNKWLSSAHSISLNLPPLNDLMDLKGVPIVESLYSKPRLVVSQPGVEAFLVHSQHFQKEGSGAIHLQINSNLAEISIKNRLMAELLNDIYMKRLSRIKDKAQQVGITVDTFVTSGDSQQLKVAGYSEKLIYLMQSMLDEFIYLAINEDVFIQAVIDQQLFYQNNLKKTGNDLVYLHLNRLTSEHATTQEEWLRVLASINLKDLQEFHQALLKHNLLRMFVAGNFSDEQAKTMALDFSQRMSSKIEPEKRSLWSYPTPGENKVIQYATDSDLADNAFLWAWFGNQKSDDEQAQIVVLNALMHAAFYRQLRTEEQLGYLIETKSFPVDDVAGVLMFVQSSTAELEQIQKRILVFRENFITSLKQMDEVQIQTARDAQIANQEQQSVNFYQESDRHWAEYIHGKYSFDGRDRHIAALQKVDKASLIAVYKSIVLNKNAGQVLIQIRGTNFKDKPFATVK